MFSDVIKEFYANRNKLFKAEKGISGQEAEIGKKLEQLNWLINRAQLLNNAIIKEPKTVDFARIEELEIITESFYHFAFRVIEIIKKHPQLKISRTKVGRVRNYLIQHPEKQGKRQKGSPSFEVGSHNGPKIKSYNGPEGAYQDEGLFINAGDFIQKLPKFFVDPDL